RRLGRDGRGHSAQAFLQLLPRDRELHPSCRLVLVVGKDSPTVLRIELLVVIVEGGEMLGNRLSRTCCVRVLVLGASDPNVWSVGIRGLPHAAPAFPHRPTRRFPTCGLECGQLLARHLYALLKGAIPHHLSLHLVN